MGADRSHGCGDLDITLPEDAGFTVDMDAIENLIEAAVYELPEKLTE